MRCEHYWREGVLLVEQGRPDPHRDTCLDCRREHEARQELIRAFTLIGANENGDPSWQSRVWRRIARDEEEAAEAGWRRWSWAGGALAAAGTLAVALPLLQTGEPRPRVETIAGATVVRGETTKVGDTIRIALRASQEVRVYHRERRVLRCTAAELGYSGCARDVAGLVAELKLELPGEYKLVIVLDGTAPAGDGTFDHDVAALLIEGRAYQVQSLRAL